ncbi:MAG: hypothetical protein K0R71_342 [Bacillales bacterium]|jgi:predicted RNA-binding protein (virulence factor B family)|nr:hypothetical protein [Bacillales bacterium]
MQVEVGNVVELEIVRETEFGFFLSDGTTDVLLHRNDLTREVSIGDKVEVFIYNDKVGRKSASMKIPKMIDDQYDWAEVVSVIDKMGAFVNVGLSKDVLVSSDDLPKLKSVWPAVGDKLYITLKVDRLNRLFARLATENIIQDLAYEAPKDCVNKPFKGRAYRVLKVGSFILTDDMIRCFVHETEQVKEPRVGELVEGRIIGITEIGDINGSLLPRGFERMDEDSQAIYDYLIGRGGEMPITDKSTPEEIEKRFGMSKAAFKRAIGRLMKLGKIEQDNGWTKAVKQEEITAKE